MTRNIARKAAQLLICRIIGQVPYHYQTFRQYAYRDLRGRRFEIETQRALGDAIVAAARPTMLNTIGQIR